jgi:SAM-dependent methyltransferase
MLEGAGASVDAIEADKLAFMRCLITKEIVGLIRAKFWLGDFVKWLENKDKNYDLIVASEVLHHVTDPLRVIELISRRTEAVYIWTHVVTEATMHRDDPNGALMQNTEKHDFHGMKVRIYRGNDSPADDNAACGGIRSDIRRWLHRDDLLEALKILGFQTVQTAHNEQSHLHGRTLSIFAHK